MTAAPLRTPPASPARAAALHTDAAHSAWNEGGLQSSGRFGPFALHPCGTSPPQAVPRSSLTGHMQSGASTSSAVSLALGDRHQRVSPGLPPLPQVRRPVAQNSAELAEAGPGSLAAAVATAAVNHLGSGRLSPAVSCDGSSRPSELTTALKQHGPNVDSTQPQSVTEPNRVCSDGRRAVAQQVASAQPEGNSDSPDFALPQ